MAKIAGITIKLSADASGVEKALKGIDSSLKKTQSNLKDINKLLKLDPGNTELLTQKQKNLENAVKLTGDRLNELKEIQSQVAEGSTEWDALQREIIATEQNLDKAKANLKDFGSVAEQKLKAAGNQMKDFGGKVEDVGKKLSKISGVAAGVLTALGGITYKSMTSADELNTLAKQTGIGTDELQKFQYASDLVDVSVEDITGALKKLKPKMKESNATFQKLGVAVTDANGELRDSMDVFYDTLDALSQIENETERDQVAMELFGKSADSLAGIIDDGGAALKEYGDEAENLGLILDQETLDSLNTMNDTVDQLKANMTGTLAQLGATLAQTFGPVLEKVAVILQTITERIRNLSPEQAEMIVKILGIIAVVGPLVLVIGKIISAVGTLMTVLPLLAGPFGIIIAVIAAVIAIGVLLYQHWDEIKAWALDLKDNLVKTWENIKDSITKTVENIKSKVTTVWTTITTTVKNKIDDLKNGIKQRFDNIRDTIQATIDRIKNIFNFQWSLPHLKVPHITVQWQPTDSAFAQFFGFSSLPHLSVDWYKKAYENAVMFTKPTVLQTPYGAKGFGDGSGAEIVMGLNKLQELVGSSGDVVINVYPSAGMNEQQLAQKIQKVFIANYKNKELLNV